MDKPDRRRVLVQGLKFFSALAVLPAVSAKAQDSHACVEPDSESLRESLSYHDPSKQAGMDCNGCGFFTAKAGGQSCGDCMILGGPVNATAYCEAFGARS